VTAVPVSGVRLARISTAARRIDPILATAGVVCALLVLLAIAGPWIAPFPPNQTDVLAASQGPSATHLLGTDSIGRDILSRLLAGARLSFLGPGIIVVLRTTLGTLFGIACAWWGGFVDSMLTKAFNVLFAIPGILMALVAAAVFGAGFWAAVLSLSLVYVPYVARVIRSAALQERRRPYVEACQLAGMSGLRICSRHVFGNVQPVVVAQATVGFGSALMDFGAASFLGIGVQPPQAEWGLMVSDGRTELLNGALQQSLSAGALIVLSVVAFNVLGERLSDRTGAGR